MKAARLYTQIRALLNNAHQDRNRVSLAATGP